MQSNRNIALFALIFSLISCTDEPAPSTTPNFDFGLDSSHSNPDFSKDDFGKTVNDMGGDTFAKSDLRNDTSVDCTCENGQLCVLDLCIPDLSRNTPQRANLADPPPGERFVLPANRIWPADTQNPHIALWYDDNYAAVSITIDDNPGPDFDWWIDTSNQFGFKVTWCVISENVENGNAFFGTWADYRRLFANGHALCSHGNVDNEPPDINAGNAMTWFDDAYKLSRPVIESKVPGARADAIAHPWGKFIRPLVSEYYIAGRGVRGGVNKANQIDYMDLRSTSRGLDKNSIDTIMGQGPDARGWFMAHFHYLQDNLRQPTFSELQYLDQFSDDIWFGRFPDVAKYGQQRDTSTLTLHASNDEYQIFSLVDEMRDEAFDFPLTIKTRLPDAWTAVTSTQNKVATRSRVVEYQGARYALIDAVPNRGPIVLIPN